MALICLIGLSFSGNRATAKTNATAPLTWSDQYQEAVGKPISALDLPNAEIEQQNSVGNWKAYQSSDPAAWLVVYERHGLVQTVQVAPKAHEITSAVGPFGVRIGDDVADLRHKARAVSIHDRVAVVVALGTRAFFGLNYAGRVDRFGVTSGNLELPPYIRWYQNSGREKRRPFAVLSGTNQTTEQIETNHILQMSCGGNQKRSILKHTTDGNQDVVESVCASGTSDMLTYFKISAPPDQGSLIDKVASVIHSLIGNAQTSLGPQSVRATALPSRPTFHLAPGVLHPAPFKTPKLAVPQATLHAIPRTHAITARGFTLKMAPAAATAPPILITGYSDPPNGRRFAPFVEPIVTEFSIASGFTPSHVELWAVGLNDPHLTTNCNNYVVSDPFESQYRVNPIPSPAPRPTPEVFPMATRRTALDSLGTVGVVHLGTSKLSVALQSGTITRKVGKFTYVYKPGAFSAVDPVSAHYAVNSDCPFSSSSNKCEPSSTSMLNTASSYCPPSGTCVAPGEVQFIVAAYVGTTVYLSNPAMYQAADDPRSFQHSGISASSNAGTVDPVSGNLFERHVDFSLAGPMAIQFSRWYDSHNSTFALAGLGHGWRHSYSDYLDLSVKCQGRVSYVDSEGNHEYFAAVAPGASSYDQQTGNTLVWNTNDTYTMTTWHGNVFNFNNGGFMTAKADRHGNQDTFAYDSYGMLSTVTDPLGRVLTYSYSGEGYNFQGALMSVAVSNGPSVSFTYGCNNSLCSVSEPDGAVWKYTYTTFDYGSYLTQTTDPNGHVAEIVTYGTVSLPEVQSGSPNWNSYRVLSQTSANSQNALSFAYAYQGNNGLDDGFSNTTITDSLKRVTTYTWSERLQQITDVVGPLCICDGGERHFVYDTFGRKVSETDGGGASLSYAYGEDVISQGTYFNGMAYSQVAYPALTQTSDLGYAYGRTKNITYESLGSATQDLPAMVSQNSYVGGDVKVTAYTYDAAGDATQIAETGQTTGGTATYTRTATFDTRGRQLTLKSPRTDLNATSSWSYYADNDSDLKRRGEIKTFTDALGHLVSLGTSSASTSSYDWFGNPITVTDPNGVVKLNAFDKMGRLTSTTIKATSKYPGDIITTSAYDKLGQQTLTTKPLGNRLLRSRDSSNRQTSEIAEDKSGNQYDKKGRSFDAMGQITSEYSQYCMTAAASCSSWVTAQTLSTSYDSKARPAQITYGPTGSAETVLGYNDPGSNALGALAYIVSGFPSDVSSGNSNVLGYLYSYNNTRLRTNAYYVTSGSASNGFSYNWSHSFSYDVNNRLSSDTPQSGPATTDIYDDWGRRITHNSPVSGVETITYDADGNMTKTLDSAGNITTLIYDALDRTTSQTSSRSNSPTESVNWSYDDSTAGNNGIGRLAKISDPSGSQTFTYDTRGNLASNAKVITGLTTYVASSVFDANGNVSSMTYPSGRIVNYTYDYADRPVTVATSATNYVSAVTYAPFGPRTSITYGNGVSEQFTLDMSYLVSRLTLTGPGSTMLVDHSFTRDGQRRISAVMDNLDATFSEKYTYDGFQLSGANTGSSLWGTDVINPDSYFYNVTGQQYSNYLGASRATGLQENSTIGWQAKSTNIGYTTTAASYDANGNTTSMSGSPYAYSARDNLSSADGVTFAYDGQDKRSKASSTSYTRGYVYGGRNELLAETASSSASVGNEYVYLEGIPVAQEDLGGSTHWTAADQLGTPFVQTDSTGKLYWYADYEPYGRVYALRTANAHQPLRRPGQEAVQVSPTSSPNGDTSVFYNQHRWYNPLFARYSQPDPLLGESSIDNPYAYTYLDPVNQIDISGLEVRLVSHPVGGKFNHAFLMLKPDYIEEFNQNQVFDTACDDQPSREVSVSGEPSEYLGNFGYGKLLSEPNKDRDSNDEHDFRSIVNAPKGVSDTDFITEILNADKYYRTHSPERYEIYWRNSNTYIRSLLASLGATLNYPLDTPTDAELVSPVPLSGPFDLAGWDNSLDANAFGPKGGISTKCPTSKAPAPMRVLPPVPSGLGVGGGGLLDDGSSDPGFLGGGAVG